MQRFLHHHQAFRIDRRVHVIQRNRTGHTADYVVRMRILPAKDNMGENEFPLLIQHLQIMSDADQMHFRRQDVVIRMVPVVSGKNAQLTAFNDFAHLILNGAKIGVGRLGEGFRIRLRFVDNRSF